MESDGSETGGALGRVRVETSSPVATDEIFMDEPATEKK